jgi:hypothetical protein
MCIEEMEEGRDPPVMKRRPKARILELVMQRQSPMDARENKRRKH